MGKVGGKQHQRRRKGQYLTARERRDLGLNRLPRSINFHDFDEMHSLWLDYMRSVVGKRSPSPQSASDVTVTSSVETLGDEQLQMRVGRATNNKLVGLEGYVVMETRNTVQIVTKKSRRKTVAKSGNYFSFCVDDILFTVDGSNMCMKPSERAVKKWKNKPPLEIIV